MRRRTRRRAMMVAGGMAYERGRGQGQAEAEQAYSQPAPRYDEVPPAPPPPAPVQSGPDLDELERLGELHKSGVLTDEEFATAKASVLGQ